MSALFNFESFVRLVVLVICTSTYLNRKFPAFFSKKEGWHALLYKCCVVGSRLSPFVAILCLFFAVKRLVNFFI